VDFAERLHDIAELIVNELDFNETLMLKLP